MLNRILLDPQGGEGNGGGGNGGNTTGFDLATVAAGLLQKHSGDANKVVMRLLRENHNYRQRLDEQRSKVPGEGSVVLGGDEAKAWAAYRELGEVKDLKKLLSDGNAAVTELAGIKQSQAYERAGEVAGFRPEAFARLAAQDKLNTVVRDVKENGKDVPQSFVVGADGKETPVKQYAEANWSVFLPALQAEAEATGKAPGNGKRPDDNTPPPAPGAGGDTTLESSLKSTGMYAL